MPVIYPFLLYLFGSLSSIPDDKIRFFEIEGKKIKTTFHTEARFIGKYEGRKGGYLILNENGSGEYKYDIFGFAPADCKPGIITFEWGFVLDERNEIVRFERDYGFSYPVIYKSQGWPSFQGCSKEIFVDYILVSHKGELSVSSSDDWIKPSVP